MMKLNMLAGIAVTVLTFSACNDETLNIGNTLTQQTDKLLISSADYNVSTKTVLADSVLMRSSYCYLGNVKDPETGAYITSEFMTQFHILESFSLPGKDKIVSIYNDMAGADSCHLEFYMETATSITDTLAALKIRVSELNHPMEETRRYYSNFDPVKEGYISDNCLKSDKMFSYQDLTVKDSLRSLSNYYHHIVIELNRPYTDKNGVVYNNYGTYIMQQYYQHPEYFKNAYTFIQNVCPGFYTSVIDGEGVYTEIPDMALRLYYKYKDDKDSIYKENMALAGTEEVLQTVKITTNKEVLQNLANDNTCTYMKAPAGLFTEVTLPVNEIFQDHANDSIMTAKISFQRINHDFYDEALRIPTYMLMVPKDSLHTFFENKMAPDNKLTFYTSYLNSSGRNATNEYTFSNISNLVTKLWNMKRSGLTAERDSLLAIATANEKAAMNTPQFKADLSTMTLEEQIKVIRNQTANQSRIYSWLATHKNWNKVLLVPVQRISSASSTTTASTSYSFENCMAIVSTKLVGGSDNPYSPVKINIVYGKFDQ